MRKIFELIIIMTVAVAFTGCILNDLPYPRIQANILTLNAEGQDGGTEIDSTNLTVTIPFPEEVDIAAVKITDYTLSPGASLKEDYFAYTLNLTQPVDVVVRLYQDYTWTIRARQNIERYFEVEGQMGVANIDVAHRRVIVDVAETQALDAIKIVKAKLGPIGSSMVPDLAPGVIVDADEPLEVIVKEYGREVVWTVYVRRVAVTVKTMAVDAFSCVAYVYGQAEAGKDNGVEYRIAGASEWTRLPKEAISSDGGNFKGRIIHMSPNTAYQARVYSGSEYGATLDFTTGGTPQMPNSNFDQWWLDKKIWYPWAENGTPYWGTGNPGAATLGQSNSTPTDDTPTGTGWAARLETRFVGLGSLGKLAAGNIFVGTFLRTEGTNGVLSFGRDFTDRPVKLRGQWKYNCTEISHSNDEMKHLLGRPDTAAVWIALIDTPEPFEVRTNPKNRQLFDPNGAYVVAYGCLQLGQSVESWTPFEFELNYRSTSRKPRYIICAGSASKFGDFFTGGNGSVLYLDNLELVYDY